MQLITWNMQGATDSAKLSKWPLVRKLVRDFGAVVCLQECGAIPDTAKDLKLPWGIAHVRTVLYPSQRDASRAREKPIFITHYAWDAAGNRTNLAIATPVQPSSVKALPEISNTIWRPALGVEIGATRRATWYFCIHAISPGGKDAIDLLRTVPESTTLFNPKTGSKTLQPWVVAGDFNREPDSLKSQMASKKIAGSICRANGNTHNAKQQPPSKMLDYAITSRPNSHVGEVQRNMADTSDHFPVLFNL